jgi:hypothetical protein
MGVRVVGFAQAWPRAQCLGGTVAVRLEGPGRPRRSARCARWRISQCAGAESGAHRGSAGCFFSEIRALLCRALTREDSPAKDSGCAPQDLCGRRQRCAHRSHQSSPSQPAQRFVVCEDACCREAALHRFRGGFVAPSGRREGVAVLPDGASVPMPPGPHQSSSRRSDMLLRYARSHRQGTPSWGAKGEISEFDSLVVVPNHVGGRSWMT